MNKKTVYLITIYTIVVILMIGVVFAIKYAVEGLDLQLPGIEKREKTKETASKLVESDTPLAPDALDLDDAGTVTSLTSKRSEPETEKEKSDQKKEFEGLNNPDDPEFFNGLNKEIEQDKKEGQESLKTENSAPLNEAKENADKTDEIDPIGNLDDANTVIDPENPVKPGASTAPPPETARSQSAETIDRLIEKEEGADQKNTGVENMVAEEASLEKIELPESGEAKKNGNDNELSLGEISDEEITSVQNDPAPVLVPIPVPFPNKNSKNKIEKPDPSDNSPADQTINPLDINEDFDPNVVISQTPQSEAAKKNIQDMLNEADQANAMNDGATGENEEINDGFSDITQTTDPNEPIEDQNNLANFKPENGKSDSPNSPADDLSLDDAEKDFRAKNPNSETDSDTVNVTGATGGNLTCSFHRVLDTGKNEERVTLTISGDDVKSKKFLVIREMDLERYINLDLDKLDGYPEKFSVLTAFCGKFKSVTTLSEDY